MDLMRPYVITTTTLRCTDHHCSRSKLTCFDVCVGDRLSTRWWSCRSIVSRSKLACFDVCVGDRLSTRWGSCRSIVSRSKLTCFDVCVGDRLSTRWWSCRSIVSRSKLTCFDVCVGDPLSTRWWSCRSIVSRSKLTCFDVCVGDPLSTRWRSCRSAVSRCTVIQLRVLDLLLFLCLCLSVGVLVVTVRLGVRLMSRVARGGSCGFPSDGFLSVRFIPVLLNAVAVVVWSRFGRPDVIVFRRKSWDRTRDFVVVIVVRGGWLQERTLRINSKIQPKVSLTLEMKLTLERNLQNEWNVMAYFYRPSRYSTTH